MLKSLELFGFKSFAERTLFEFAPGVTCVVGPNGSGKSNVVDSIKWILGDQSPKSLRGKEMADVIFNGSAVKKPSQFAEATLTFDNTDGVIPFEAGMIQIGRRLYRGGDSEYLLNGNVVRLKDVRDLLLGTGAGTAAYSIIEQGRVDQILQSNPVSRRQVFEEAAGISRFKSKRVDAERRLERVAQNLVRLTDIVDQIESQLNATRSQATKAAKFRELSQELRTLWTGLAGDDSRRLSAEETDLNAKLQVLRDTAAALETSLASFEAARRDIESELSERDGAIRDLERQVASLRQSIASGVATIKHHSERGEELSLEIEQCQSQQVSLAGEASLADRELSDTGERLARLEESIAGRRESYETRQTQAADIQLRLSAAKEDAARQRISRDSTQESLGENRRRLATLESQLEAGQAALEELETRRDASADRERLAEEAAADARSTLDDAEQHATEARERLDAILAERTRLSTELTRLELQLNQRREERSTWHARHLVLQEWEQSQRGIGQSVREFLDRAAQNTGSPWSSVRGIVTSLLDVPLENAPIIDLVLGELSQAIVVDRLDPWLTYWRSTSSAAAGRVAFIGLSDAAPGLPQNLEQDLRARPGVAARADDVVAESELAPGLARRLLGHVWIVSDLGVAEDILEIGNGRIDCVTLQGEFLHRDGRLTVGVASSEGGAVSRRSELRQLTLDLRRLERTIEAETRRLAELTAQHVARDTAVTQADDDLRRRLEAVSSARALLEMKVQEHQRLASETRILDDQWQADRIRRDRLVSEIAEQRAAAAALSAEADRLTQSIAALQSEIEFVDAELKSLHGDLDSERLELAKQEERLASLNEAYTRFERDQTVRKRQLDECETRLRQLHEGLSRSRLAVDTASAEVSTLTSQVESLQVTLQQLDESRSAVRGRRQEILREEETCRRERHAAVDSTHQLEMQSREITQQRTALEARMQEEFQLTLAEIEASGVSAYGDLIQSRGETSTDATEEALEPTDAAPTWSASVPPTFLEVRPELESQVERLRRRIKALGHVNTEALNDLDELEQRFADLSGQHKDLQEAKAALEDIIRRINAESKKLFIATFTTIQGHFRELFRKLFGGGEAEIVLENQEDVLECGIDIVARPPGKELRSISLLSGGEKTLTAVALLFAMFKSKPSPYCILDEVDAALDEANVERYAGIVKDFVSMTQFVIITHRKRTMTAADRLYGVTMEQAGISKRMSVRFEEVGEHGEILSTPKAKAA